MPVNNQCGISINYLWSIIRERNACLQDGGLQELPAFYLQLKLYYGEELCSTSEPIWANTAAICNPTKVTSVHVQ